MEGRTLNKKQRPEKGYDRNYWALTLEGSAFTVGISMIAANGVVPLFIDTMTGSKALVGLAITLQALFVLLGQLICAPHINSIRNLPGFIFKAMLSRCIPILMAIPLFLGAGRYLAAGVFLALYALLWFGDGVITMPWGELAARALKPELRGHMMGMTVTIGGVVSLLTGLLLTRLLSTPALSENNRFGIIFLLASALLLLSLFFIRLAKDPSPNTTFEKTGFLQYYRRLPGIIKGSKPLQHALLARMPGYIGFSAVTFMVLFGAATLELTDSQVSWLVYAQIVGGLAGGYLLGESSRRFGNKTVILVCNAGVLITLGMAATLAFFPGLGYVWLVLSCGFAGIWSTNWLGYFNYFLDIAPREHRPSYQVVGNCIGIPFSFAGYALGAVIDSWGFMAAFAIAGLTATVAILLSIPLLSRKKIESLSHYPH